MVAVLGGTISIAAGSDGDPSVHPRAGDGHGSLAVTPIVGVSAGAPCKMGYDTRNQGFTPLDDTTADNLPVAAVTLTKRCTGAVIGQFTSETLTDEAGEFIHLDMYAKCVATGGLTNPCTVGKTVTATPGHNFFAGAVVTGYETHAMDMVWPPLKRGRWQFTVRSGGNGTASLVFRTFHVEAY